MVVKWKMKRCKAYILLVLIMHVACIIATNTSTTTPISLPTSTPTSTASTTGKCKHKLISHVSDIYGYIDGVIRRQF